MDYDLNVAIQLPTATVDDDLPTGPWGDFLRGHLPPLIAELGEEDVGTENGVTRTIAHNEEPLEPAVPS